VFQWKINSNPSLKKKVNVTSNSKCIEALKSFFVRDVDCLACALQCGCYREIRADDFVYYRSVVIEAITSNFYLGYYSKGRSVYNAFKYSSRTK